VSRDELEASLTYEPARSLTGISPRRNRGELRADLLGRSLSCHVSVAAQLCDDFNFGTFTTFSFSLAVLNFWYCSNAFKMATTGSIPLAEKKERPERELEFPSK
jgi:hypothetical protein